MDAICLQTFESQAGLFICCNFHILEAFLFYLRMKHINCLRNLDISYYFEVTCKFSLEVIRNQVKFEYHLTYALEIQFGGINFVRGFIQSAIRTSKYPIMCTVNQITCVYIRFCIESTFTKFFKIFKSL